MKHICILHASIYPTVNIYVLSGLLFKFATNEPNSISWSLSPTALDRIRPSSRCCIPFITGIPMSPWDDALVDAIFPHASLGEAPSHPPTSRVPVPPPLHVRGLCGPTRQESNKLVILFSM